jgi:hypothetical protein
MLVFIKTEVDLRDTPVGAKLLTALTIQTCDEVYYNYKYICLESDLDHLMLMLDHYAPDFEIVNIRPSKEEDIAF